MDALNNLFAQYSIEGIIIIIVALAVAIKFVGELIEYFYGRLRTYFNHQNARDKAHSEITDGLKEIKEHVNSLEENVDNINQEIIKLKNQTELASDRLQENAKCYIMDKHHYFCYEKKIIDDASLQSLERRFLFYKNAGGDSYIDGLMQEIRDLPRATIHNTKPQ